MTSLMTFLVQTSIWLIPVLLAITVHESGHAWAANHLGDDTAKRLKRLSINPFRHISLIGTILVPLCIAFITHFQFVFGWAKPVPINAAKLKNPRRDEAFIAAAGPFVNFIMAALWMICCKISLIPAVQMSSIGFYLFSMGQAGVLINLILLFLNLIPIPPLDGSRILASILPPKYAAQYMKIEPYGFIILLVLLLSQTLSYLLGLMTSYASSILTYFLG